MREIRTSGLMSGEGKRVASAIPRLSSTLLLRLCLLRDPCTLSQQVLSILSEHWLDQSHELWVHSWRRPHTPDYRVGDARSWRLGPGRLEPVYHRCLCHELPQAGIRFGQQVRLPIRYDDIAIETGYLLKLKTVEQFSPLNEAQLLTYLRLSSCRIGLLINFNTVSLTDSISCRVL